VILPLLAVLTLNVGAGQLGVLHAVGQAPQLLLALFGCKASVSVRGCCGAVLAAEAAGGCDRQPVMGVAEYGSLDRLPAWVGSDVAGVGEPVGESRKEFFEHRPVKVRLVVQGG